MHWRWQPCNSIPSYLGWSTDRRWLWMQKCLFQYCTIRPPKAAAYRQTIQRLSVAGGSGIDYVLLYKEYADWWLQNQDISFLAFTTYERHVKEIPNCEITTICRITLILYGPAVIFSHDAIYEKKKLLNCESRKYCRYCAYSIYSKRYLLSILRYKQMNMELVGRPHHKEMGRIHYGF